MVSKGKAATGTSKPSNDVHFINTNVDNRSNEKRRPSANSLAGQGPRTNSNATESTLTSNTIGTDICANSNMINGTKPQTSPGLSEELDSHDLFQSLDKDMDWCNSTSVDSNALDLWSNLDPGSLDNFNFYDFSTFGANPLPYPDLAFSMKHITESQLDMSPPDSISSHSIPANGNITATTCAADLMSTQAATFFSRPKRTVDAFMNGGDNTTARSLSIDSNSESGQSTRKGASRYLQTYYRLSLPRKMTNFSDNDLVQHYFKSVCPVLSCCDSSDNPFRTLVSETWTKSITTSLSAQSMALAHMTNHYPSLASLALRKRSEAWNHLQRDLRHYRLGKIQVDRILLNVLLLGISSSWLQPTNLGIPYLVTARNLLQTMIESQIEHAQFDFFQEALMYWEMLVSFVDPMPIIAVPGQLELPAPEDPMSTPISITPHPWTGIGTAVTFAFAEIGRILRRQHASSAPTKSGERLNVSLKFDEDWATKLEAFLHAINMPAIEQIEDFDDKSTSKEDLVCISKAYRLICLIELYRLFPNLLIARCQSHSEVDGFVFHLPYGLVQGDQEVIQRSVITVIQQLAEHTITMVSKIPVASSVSRSLPLALIACASAIYSPQTPPDTEDMGQDHVDHHVEHHVEPRRFVEERMLELSRKYPRRPMQQMLQIKQEVWQRLDDGAPHAHWIDVIHQKGWQTLMG